MQSFAPVPHLFDTVAHTATTTPTAASSYFDVPTDDEEWARLAAPAAKPAPVKATVKPDMPRQFARKTIPHRSTDVRAHGPPLATPKKEAPTLVAVASKRTSPDVAPLPKRVQAYSDYSPAPCASCHCDDAHLLVPCGWYCGCDDIQLCLGCFAGMKYGPGVVCNRCAITLDSAQLLADQRVLRAFHRKFNLGPGTMQRDDAMLALREWVALGAPVHQDVRISSTPRQLLQVRRAQPGEQAWAYNGRRKEWVALQPDDAMLMQCIGCSTALVISKHQPIAEMKQLYA